MKKIFKKFCINFLIVTIFISSLSASSFFSEDVQAATFSDINSSSVFLTQTTSSNCTLYAATMMIRRAAILNSDSTWTSITADSVGNVAWVAAGLKHSFTYTSNAGKSYSATYSDYGIATFSVVSG